MSRISRNYQKFGRNSYLRSNRQFTSRSDFKSLLPAAAQILESYPIAGRPIYDNGHNSNAAAVAEHIQVSRTATTGDFDNMVRDSRLGPNIRAVIQAIQTASMGHTWGEILIALRSLLMEQIRLHYGDAGVAQFQMLYLTCERILQKPLEPLTLWTTKNLLEFFNDKLDEHRPGPAEDS